jgi:hypothetical protein
MSGNSGRRLFRRSRFIPEEDELLKRLVAQYGTKDWHRIQEVLPDRNVRQCRDRWNHYLAHESDEPAPPGMNEAPITESRTSLGRQGSPIFPGIQRLSAAELEGFDTVASGKTDGDAQSSSTPMDRDAADGAETRQLTFSDGFGTQEQLQTGLESEEELSLDQLLSRRLARDNALLWLG